MDIKTWKVKFWPRKDFRLTLQTRTVLSVQAVARYLQLVENWQSRTGAVWVSVMISAFLFWSRDRSSQVNTAEEEGRKQME